MTLQHILGWMILLTPAVIFIVFGFSPKKENLRENLNAMIVGWMCCLVGFALLLTA